MKFIIDTEQCKNSDIPISTALYLASTYFGETIDYNTFDDACRKGYIVYSGFDKYRDPIGIEITQDGIDAMETVLLNSEFRPKEESKDRFDVLAEKLQELYPKGRKPGTAYMWRDSTPVIAKKLKTLVKKFNCKFTDEEAVNAAQTYISSFNGDYRYMQVLKYFILKRDNNTGDENSQLLSYIQNAGQEDVNTEWTAELR